MGRRTHTLEQIINKLREVDVFPSQGAAVAEASKKTGIAEQIYYRWRREYDGMGIGQQL